MKLLRSGLLIAAVLGAGQTAIAADMAVKGPRVAPAPVWSWTGFYAGVHAGWGWANDDAASHSFTSSLPGILPLSVSGVASDNNGGPLFGGHLGYNWQLNPNWVIGIEGDITGSGIHNSGATGGAFSPLIGIAIPGDALAVQRDVDWLATVRGRLGYTWGTSMIYFTGGAAWAGIDYRSTYTNAGIGGFCVTVPPGVAGCSVTSRSDDTKSGWVLGGGYEALLAGNWMWRVEYLFYSFENVTTAATIPAFTGTGVGCTVGACTSSTNFGDLDIHTVRLGLSYKF